MKEIWEIFTDIWHLARKYEFHKLTEAQWEQFVSSGKQLLTKYQGQGAAIENLYRDLFMAVQVFYERLETEP